MDTPYPTRKRLDHRGPLSIGTTDAVYFITIAAAERGTAELSDKADAILSAARHYQSIGKWFLHIFLIMPDHIHMLVHVPTIMVGRGVLDAPYHYKTKIRLNPVAACPVVTPYHHRPLR